MRPTSISIRHPLGYLAGSHRLIFILLLAAVAVASLPADPAAAAAGPAIWVDEWYPYQDSCDGTGCWTMADNPPPHIEVRGCGFTPFGEVIVSFYRLPEPPNKSPDYGYLATPGKDGCFSLQTSHIFLSSAHFEPAGHGYYPSGVVYEYAVVAYDRAADRMAQNTAYAYTYGYDAFGKG